MEDSDKCLNAALMRLRKMLVKSVCVLVPRKRWRKALRKKLLPAQKNPAFATFEQAFLEIKTKKSQLLKSKNEIKHLFLGSSHVAYGFNPLFFKNGAFNAGSNSQDLFTSFYLFSVVRDMLPNLKNILLGYDVFSRGWNLSRTSASHICSAYKYLYNIDYEPPNYEKGYIKKCSEFNKFNLKGEGGGYLNPPEPAVTDDVFKRTDGHMKEHNRENSQHIWIEKLADMRKNAEFTLITFPVRQDYREMCRQKGLSFKEIDEMAERLHIRYLNFFDDADFIYEDFYDFDHLNPQGAEKFSKKLGSMFDD